MKKFRPMLAPNDKVELNEIKYPLLASTKLDGYRCIFNKGEILTRSLKQVQNKQLREKFETLRKYSEDNNLILDGEIYSHELTFQQLNKFFMSEDLESARSIKRYGEVFKMPEHVKFYLFDCIKDDDFDTGFVYRDRYSQDIANKFPGLIILVEQRMVNSKEEVEDMFEFALERDYEGLILKDIGGRYKCGRGTVKEGLIFKVKPFLTFDAKIINVEQATKVDPNAERKINELGRSVTSRKQGNRHLIEKACAFVVKYNNIQLKVSLAMIDIEKEEVWKNRDSYIGKTIEYKGMLVGAKSVPRHPVFVRFRNDKD